MAILFVFNYFLNNQYYGRIRGSVLAGRLLRVKPARRWLVKTYSGSQLTIVAGGQVTVVSNCNGKL